MQDSEMRRRDMLRAAAATGALSLLANGKVAMAATADIRVLKVSTRGVDWHVEQRGAGPDIVLIPSGEGHCAVYDVVAADLARDFRVTTFDTPGFSRSTVSDPGEISVIKLAGQIADLTAALGIKQAVYYGCSSGGLAVLDLVADHSQLVRRAIVHEAALPDRRENEGPMFEMAKLDDAGIAAGCERLFATVFNENPVAWKALGEDYHRRLAKNYPIWVRQYVVKLSEHKPVDPAALIGKPITWTIGGLFEVRFFFSNVQLAHRAGVALGMLPSRHFPQVSIPATLAAHIRSTARLA